MARIPEWMRTDVREAFAGKMAPFHWLALICQLFAVAVWSTSTNTPWSYAMAGTLCIVGGLLMVPTAILRIRRKDE